LPLQLFPLKFKLPPQVFHELQAPPSGSAFAFGWFRCSTPNARKKASLTSEVWGIKKLARDDISFFPFPCLQLWDGIFKHSSQHPD
jgi:hypothetical protein